MAIAFCQGRGREPFATLVAKCPGRARLASAYTAS